jgi:hypothetical protein
MRIGTLIRSYGLTDYLDAVLRSYSWVDKILVMNYRFKDVPPRKDDTALLTIPYKNAEVKTGEGLNQHEVYNLGLEDFKDFDCVFIADNDELITRQDQDKVVGALKDHNGVVGTLIEYARDYEHIYPIRGHKPIIAANPELKFYDVRCAGGSKKQVDVFIHHFGYVYKDADLDWKLDWERKWEGDNISSFICQSPQRYDMPEEIRKML